MSYHEMLKRLHNATQKIARRMMDDFCKANPTLDRADRFFISGMIACKCVTIALGAQTKWRMRKEQY